METQGLQELMSRYWRETLGGFLQRPIGFYTMLIGIALGVLFVIHTLLLLIPPLSGWITSSSVIQALLAVLYCWLFLGLGVCLLLYFWLKSKPVASIVTLILATSWLAIVLRCVEHDILFIKITAALLAVAIPLLAWLWFLRPFHWLLPALATVLWFLGWGFLCMVLQEYRAGTLLLASLIAVLAVFLIGLCVACGFLLPLPDRRYRGKVFNFLRDYWQRYNFPAYVVVDALMEEDKIEERVPGSPFAMFAKSPGFVITGCDHAVAISDGVKFKGVQGPGVVFTGFADQIMRTIDLRPQLRTFYVEALTKDGIGIRVLTFVPFKIDARGQRPELGKPLPYNKSAAFQAIYAQKLEHEGKGQIPERTKQRGWDELPVLLSERILQNIISEYNFDDLYGPYQAGGVPPRKLIAQIFCARLDEELRPLGIQRVGGGISDLEPADPRVYLEKVRSWQADWMRKATLRRARGYAERLGIIERARAETRAELILNLGRRLEELSATATELRPEVILNQFLAMLEEITMQPMMRRLLPRETWQAIGDIRRALPE
jgi:regulator of protease activity HflC (stomatin/prohibitin superfamily)